MKVFNALGGEVATLVDEQQTAGLHRVEWEATHLASGMYFYRIQAGLPLGGSPWPGRPTGPKEAALPREFDAWNLSLYWDNQIKYYKEGAYHAEQ